MSAGVLLSKQYFNVSSFTLKKQKYAIDFNHIIITLYKLVKLR